MRLAPGAMEVGDQNFAAPDLPIRPIPGAVERNADHRPREMVLRHAAGDMRVVVLHRNGPDVPLLQSPLGREIAGMQIVGDRRRLPLQDALEVSDGLLKDVVGG